MFISLFPPHEWHNTITICNPKKKIIIINHRQIYHEKKDSKHRILKNIKSIKNSITMKNRIISSSSENSIAIYEPASILIEASKSNICLCLFSSLAQKSRNLSIYWFMLAPRYYSWSIQDRSSISSLSSLIYDRNRGCSVYYNATGHVGEDQFVWCRRIVTRATLLWLLPWERNLPFYGYPSFSASSSSQSILELFQFDTHPASRFRKSPRIIFS